MSRPRLALALPMAAAATLASPTSARADATHTCVSAASEGQNLRDRGQLTAAHQAFTQCSSDACPALVREDCRRWNQELDARLPTIVLGARDKDDGGDLVDVRVTIDGKPLVSVLDGRSLPVDPGPHTLVFEARGHAPERAFVVVREGEHVRPVVATLARAAAGAPAAPTASPVSTAPAASTAPGASPGATGDAASSSPRLAGVLVGAAAGVLGFATFAVLGSSGAAEKTRLSSSCAPSETCSTHDLDALRTKLVVADIGLVVGSAGVLVAGALLVVPLFRPGRGHGGVAITGAPLRGGALAAAACAF